MGAQTSVNSSSETANSPRAAGAAPADPTQAATLFQHRKRPQWGLAVVVWEQEGKRGYQFADGQIRVIKEGFYNLLEPATAPGDGTGRSVVRMARRRAGGDDALLPSVRHQALFMQSQFAEGFDDPAWYKHHRGEGRRLKRHRKAALDDAAAKWSMAAMNGYLEAADYAGIMNAAVEVLSKTDLVSPKHVKALAALAPSEQLARSFVNLVHDHDGARAVGAFAEALAKAGGPATSWPLVTAPRALMVPHEDLCVRPSVMKLQGRILMPGFKASSKPNARDYANYRKVARALRSELDKSFDLGARDLLDIYDFVWVTLRPGSREDVMAAG